MDKKVYLSEKWKQKACPYQFISLELLWVAQGCLKDGYTKLMDKFESRSI